MKKHVFAIAFVVVAAIVSWYRVLGQSLMGEGFYYLFHGLGYESFWGTFWEMLRSYEAGAKMLFDFFRVFFKDNIFLYQLFLLISVSIINVLFYVFAYVLTKRFLAAFVASMLFSINFVGFEMFAIGNYQFFAQRTLAFLFLFPSITLFILYLRGNRFIYYLISVFLYLIAFFLFHFTLFFTPFYICVVAMFGKKKKLLSILVFFIIPIIILRYGNDPVSKDINVFSFIRQFGWQIPTAMMKHFTILTVPETLLSYLGKAWNMAHGEVALRLFYPVAVLYLFTLRINKKLFSIAVWCLLFLLPTFFIGLYTRWDMTNNLGSGSRYLYVPTIAFAIYWGIVLATVRKKYLIVIMGIWALMQLSSINKGFGIEQEKHEAMEKSMRYVKQISSRFASDSIVIVPRELGYYGSYFAQLFYGRERTAFIPRFSQTVEGLSRPFDTSKDYILEYDRTRHVVVDRTHEYQSILKQ